MENTDISGTEIIEVPEFVQEYIEPISGDSPAGTDVSNEEEFFKLNMEIPKTSPDYKKCIELSDIILKEKSKDIKVAAWLSFALFRTEKIKGLKNGLNIIYYLLKNFENKLFPANDLHKVKALQFINTPRFYKLVEREEVSRTNADDIIEAGKILRQIVGECERLFPGNVPVLKSVKEAIDNHVEKAQSIISPPKKETASLSSEQKENKAESHLDGENNKTIVSQPVKAEQLVPSSTAASIKEISRFSGTEKDGINQLRQILTFFFESQQDGSKKEKVPESFFVFGLSRQLQWGKLYRPPDNDKVTQVEAPNQIIQNKIKEWFAGSNWDTLIPRIEISFLKGDSEFPYWLDAQRYVTKSLEQKGGNYTQAAEDIKIHLAKLLIKIPDLPQLKFKDKQTPFADDETIKWINDEVKPSLSGGKSNESIILPPILGEDYSAINDEYQTACSELPGKFEENLTSMQKGLEADIRRKGKFLRRLNITNFCYQAKQYRLAKVNLLELKKFIDDYLLSEWEPALSTAVYESLYLTNNKLLIDSSDEVSKSNIEKEQQELFSKIAKYDGLLAIKLTQKNKP